MAVLRLTLRQLQIFAAIADMGSTAAAGVRIGLSQSATSAALNELERLLATLLFDRLGKRLVLNAHGRALLPRALALLDGAMEIERTVGGEQASPLSLRVGASTTIGNYVLPRVLGRFWGGTAAAEAPLWQAQVMVGNTARVCAAVADFSIDVGLIEGPCNDAQLEVRPWVSDALRIVASPERGALLAAGLAAGAVVPLRRLREQVWLLRESGSGTRVATDLALLPYLHVYRRSIEVGNSEAIKHGAAEGLGLACLSEWVVADLLASGRLVVVPTALAHLRRQCYLVVHRRKQRSVNLDRLISVLRQPA